MPIPNDPKTDVRCPVCGSEGLADIAFDAQPADGPQGGPPQPAQTADSRQLITYACGHQVPGPSLADADQTELEVERRSSEDTTEPSPGP